MTASQLRAKEGSSGTRETVAVRGIEVTLVYGADRRVSRIELPGVGPDGTRESLDQVVLDLVPMSLRGEKRGSGLREAGGRHYRATYEHVTIFEREDQPDNKRSLVWIQFKDSYQSSSIS